MTSIFKEEPLSARTVRVSMIVPANRRVTLPRGLETGSVVDVTITVLLTAEEALDKLVKEKCLGKE